MENSELINIYYSFKDVQAVGIDGTSKEKFDEIITEELPIIIKKFENNTYDFSYYKQKLLVKSINKTREISIPTLRDKLVLKYLYNYINKSYKDEMKDILQSSEIINQIKKSKNDYDSFIKVDIQNFFPSINHDILIDKLKQKIDNENIINLIKKAITQTTVDVSTPSKQRIKYNNKIGIPQGLSISGLLSEIYIADLEKKYKSKSIKFFRYVDDILILCKKEDLEQLKNSLRVDFEELKLTIHDFEETSVKSSFGNINDSFEFLGHRLEKELISVRDSSSQKMFINLSKMFTQYKNNKYISKEQFIKKLNVKITGCVIEGKKYGWIQFFSQINDHQLLFSLDSFVQKNCKKLNIDYENVKKFSRAIYEIRNPDTNYLDNNTKEKLDLSGLEDFEDFDFYWKI